MDRYDADQNPDPIAWLDLDESERIELVLDSHRPSRLPPPALRLHAAIHVVVENQLAHRSPLIVVDTLERLQREGLSRHDGVHAIGALVSERLAAALKPATESPAELNARYETAVGQLKAENWRQSGAAPDIPEVVDDSV